MDIQVGRVYRAKKPANCGGFFNDRQVIFASAFEVQYDGPAVANGRRYPKVDRAKFEQWAGEDVTEKLPEGDWAPYNP